MKTLYIVRHAKSSWEYQGVKDIDRPLKKRGINATIFEAEDRLGGRIYTKKKENFFLRHISLLRNNLVYRRNLYLRLIKLLKKLFFYYQSERIFLFYNLYS